jgi:hypothetical protein
MNRIVQAAAAATLSVSAGSAFGFEPLTIADQGSFAVGGTVIETPGTYANDAPTPEGQSFHGDHAYAFYQISPDAQPLPLVLWHGAYPSGRSAAGRQPRMGARASRRCSCAGAFRSM